MGQICCRTVYGVTDNNDSFPFFAKNELSFPSRSADGGVIDTHLGVGEQKSKGKAGIHWSRPRGSLRHTLKERAVSLMVVNL